MYKKLLTDAYKYFKIWFDYLVKINDSLLTHRGSEINYSQKHFFLKTRDLSTCS